MAQFVLSVSKDFLYCVVLFSRILSLKYFDFALQISTTAVFQALLYIVQASILFLARPLNLSLTNICWRVSWVFHPGSSLFFTLWVTCGMCSFITFINRVFQIVRLSSTSEEASSTDHDNYDSAVEFEVQKNKMNNNFELSVCCCCCFFLETQIQHFVSYIRSCIRRHTLISESFE